MKNFLTRLCATALASMACTGIALAQSSYPSKPIRVIVPYPAGGIVDAFARVVTDNIAKRSPAYSFVVENRVGASGNIGTQAARNSPADGYTWLFTASSSLAANPVLYKNAGWDAVKDFTGVGNVGYASLVLSVNARSPARTVRELVDLARLKPASVTAGIMYGSSAQFTLEALSQAASFKLLMVPYKGAPPALLDLLGGNLEVGMLPPPIAQPYVRTGQVRPLAIAGAKRSSLLPDVPTFAEAGFPQGAVIVPWYGFLVPRKTPPAVIKQINAEIGESLTTPDVRERLLALGGELAVPMTVEQIDRLIKSDTENYAALIKSANITVE